MRIRLDKSFRRDLPASWLPALRRSLRMLQQIRRERWYDAGIGVTKLKGFPYPVYELRLTRGDRVIFTFGRTNSEQGGGLEVVLRGAGTHDDAVRTAARRMGLMHPIREQVSEYVAADPDALGLSWDNLDLIGGEGVLCGKEVTDADALVRATDNEDGTRLRKTEPAYELSLEDLDRWAEHQLDPLLHLTPEQRELTRANEYSPIFLSGGVGTGKTTVLLYRMLKLLMTGTISRPVFLTYKKTLAGWCRSMFERLPGWQRFEVEFTSLSRWVKDNSSHPVNEKAKAEFVKSWRLRRFEGDAEGKWRELRRLRGSAAFGGRQPVSGDDLPESVDPSLRAAYSDYRKRLGRAKDVMDLMWEAYDRLLRAKPNELPYDAVFIDEAQDLTPIEWLVCVLMGSRPNLAFFCADQAQDILDTRFSWSSVKGALRLLGKRAPEFVPATLVGNQRNSAPIAAFLQAISERFGLGASVGNPMGKPGPSPKVCVGSHHDAVALARLGRCPILLDLSSPQEKALREQARADEEKAKDPGLFRELDLDNIKGLEFEVLPVWAPSSAWPLTEADARRLLTAMSRALTGLVIVTDPGRAADLEALGATRAAQPELSAMLAELEELIQMDRESIVRWSPPTFERAQELLKAGCSWNDFRPCLAAWYSKVPLELADAWVAAELCTWSAFSARIDEWVGNANQEQALAWVRDGLCERERFAARIPAWVRNAELEQATCWVEGGLCTWQDFKARVHGWVEAATRNQADAWVKAGVCRWRDFYHHVRTWIPEADLAQAIAWVELGRCTWPDFASRVAQWYDRVPLELAQVWVSAELCTWNDVAHRIPGWLEAAPFELAERWVEAGLCTWEQAKRRIPEWTGAASFQLAQRWVELELCTWKDFGSRVDSWVSDARLDLVLEWLRGGLCEPSCVWPRIRQWTATIRFTEAEALVHAGCCSWYEFSGSLPEWIPEASLVQAQGWVSLGLCAWKDFSARIADWSSEATLEQASAWVLAGVCTWNSFEARIPKWIPAADLEHATAWVECGLAQWSQFEGKHHVWAPRATVQQIQIWFEMKLIGKPLWRRYGR